MLRTLQHIKEQIIELFKNSYTEPIGNLLTANRSGK